MFQYQLQIIDEQIIEDKSFSVGKRSDLSRQ